ncbi:serine/threonine transporter SstT [Sutterella sp.]|uniref:serine/threonine transporter SstT n=1 Tax=Sutterella sp. TaxID=1981025 RepID=UPI0026DF2F4F|nr:serine/threonine transporter SstT [Sutterella sp.]MDO5532413.1 serine/threonine transporter SstT [Sutterella sp.]
MQRVFKFALPFLKGSLVRQIVIGLVLGTALGLTWPDAAADAGILGTLFVSALKGVAPVLVFMLVMSAIANQQVAGAVHMKPIIALYLFGTFLASMIAVAASLLFPSTLALQVTDAAVSAPGGIAEVVRNLLLQAVDNPVHALGNANYIGILVWAVAMGVVLRSAKEETREVLSDAASAVSFIVRIVIRFAPFGVFGIVASTIAETGFDAFAGYVKVLAVLVGTMAFLALVVNPFLVWLCTHENPYPLTLMTLRDSGVPAFFTRSSAANIPVNLGICRRLGLPESTFSISIPVGATINAQGAAITITVLTLAGVTTLGIPVDLFTAVLLSFATAVCAAGAAGVPGGSLMLIPLACGLFGVDQNAAMQVVAVGFIIGVIQDSCETALNSSTDVLFTAAACRRAERLAAGETAEPRARKTA